MKHLIFSSLVFLIATPTFSQVTITHTSLPQPGDTFAMHYDANPTINYGTASSSSQHFDFTQLQTDEDKYAAYGITANLPFASEFPQSNLYTYGPSVIYGGPGASVPTGNGWMLFRTDINGMDVIGYKTDNGTNDVSTVEVPPRMLMRTPCTLGTNETQDAVWTYMYDAVATDYDTIVKSFSHTVLNCDAWGTISTPVASNVDVVRVNKTTLVIDSAYIVLNGTTYWKGEIQRASSNNFDFYATTKRHPIATVFCNQSGTAYGAEYLFYEDLYNSTENLTSTPFSIYPNPVKNVLKINANTTDLSYEIVDINGSIIQAGAVNNNIIDTKELNAGLYLIRLTSASSFQTLRFVKE